MGDRKPSEFFRSLFIPDGSNFTPNIIKKLELKNCAKV